MKTYRFTIYLEGSGETVAEAWEDAAGEFDLQRNYLPAQEDIQELYDEEDIK